MLETEQGGTTIASNKAGSQEREGLENPQSAQFGNLTKDAVASSPQNLDFLLDIPLDVTVELGRTKMLVSDLLQLGQGSVVELEKLAGEAVEVLVNGKLIARGEVVVVNEKFGVRLTDIISPLDRIKQLK